MQHAWISSEVYIDSRRGVTIASGIGFSEQVYEQDWKIQEKTKQNNGIDEGDETKYMFLHWRFYLTRADYTWQPHTSWARMVKELYRDTEWQPGNMTKIIYEVFIFSYSFQI